LQNHFLHYEWKIKSKVSLKAKTKATYKEWVNETQEDRLLAFKQTIWWLVEDRGYSYHLALHTSGLAGWPRNHKPIHIMTCLQCHSNKLVNSCNEANLDIMLQIFKGRGARAGFCGPPLIHTYIGIMFQPTYTSWASHSYCYCVWYVICSAVKTQSHVISCTKISCLTMSCTVEQQVFTYDPMW
jgi:hypothetical protein